MTRDWLARRQGTTTTVRSTKRLLRALALVPCFVALMATPALAAGPPEEPETTKASAVTTTTAVLEGVLNPKAVAPVAAGWYFAYSTETTCAASPTFAPKFPPGAPEETVKAKTEKMEVKGLQPNKEYTFCMVATNEGGVNVIPSVKEVKIKTKPAPPEVKSESCRRSKPRKRGWKGWSIPTIRSRNVISSTRRSANL